MVRRAANDDVAVSQGTRVVQVVFKIEVTTRTHISTHPGVTRIGVISLSACQAQVSVHHQSPGARSGTAGSLVNAQGASGCERAPCRSRSLNIGTAGS